MNKYDLVTVRRYNGVEDGSYSWTFLSYAIVIPTENNKAVCLRNENIQYEYMPTVGRDKVKDSYDLLNIGDIRIFPAFDYKFDSIKFKTKSAVLKYLKESTFYFDDDILYGDDITLEKPKTLIKK